MDRRWIASIAIFTILSGATIWGNKWISEEITQIQTMSSDQPVQQKKIVKKKRIQKPAGIMKIDPKNDPLAPIAALKPTDEPKPKHNGPKQIYDFSSATDILAQ